MSVRIRKICNEKKEDSGEKYGSTYESVRLGMALGRMEFVMELCTKPCENVITVDTGGQHFLSGRNLISEKLRDLELRKLMPDLRVQHFL